MNPQWNTPPDGDFARYVERLSAQAALPRRAPQEGEHGLDVGMTPSPPSPLLHAAPAEAARRNANTAPHNLAKGLAIAWVVALAGLWISGAPTGVFMVVLVFGILLGLRLRRWALPPGVANWRQWLEEEARKQQLKQQQKRGR